MLPEEIFIVQTFAQTTAEKFLFKYKAVQMWESVPYNLSPLLNLLLESNIKYFFFPINDSRCHSMPLIKICFSWYDIYDNNVPVNSNSKLYKSWFFSNYISDMTVANSKASAPLATVHILSRFSIN